VITHPEKMMFPDDGITKGELASYYETIGPLMLPHLSGRPLTMERYPASIAKKGFIQKDVSKGAPAWLERVSIPKKDGASLHPLVNDARALAWIANQNCVTPHVWASRVPELLHPDLCVFDLDPTRDDAAALREGALAVRALLDEFGLPSWVKTSGSKGFHIVVPLDRVADYAVVSDFAYRTGALLVKRHPALFTQEFIKADREERILVDTGRNHYGATFAATYAVRARASAPVSAPCTWDELAAGTVTPRSFHLRNISERVASAGELWKELHARPSSLESAREKLSGLLTDEELRAAHAASVRKPKARKAAPARH
jgi:bifunctional non-homologous end joining protein LigD